MTAPATRHDPITRWGRAGAAYDLAVTVWFATPWTAVFVFDGLRNVHTTLDLPGTPPPSPSGTALLMTTLFGVVVSMWSLARWLHPEPSLIVIDTIGRLAFSTWFTWALIQGESLVLSAFLLLELVWTALQGRALLIKRYGPARAHR